jgi:hypothetical protein
VSRRCFARGRVRSRRLRHPWRSRAGCAAGSGSLTSKRRVGRRTGRPNSGVHVAAPQHAVAADSLPRFAWSLAAERRLVRQRRGKWTAVGAMCRSPAGSSQDCCWSVGCGFSTEPSQIGGLRPVLPTPIQHRGHNAAPSSLSLLWLHSWPHSSWFGLFAGSAPLPNMPLQRTRSRALLGRSPLNGGSLGCESDVQRCRGEVSPAAEIRRGATVAFAEHAPGAPRVPGASRSFVETGGAPAGPMRASMSPHPNMPLQRTRTPRFARRCSPLNGGSLDGDE